MKKSPTMPTLYDVAHFCSWNGYTEDMRSYLGVDKAAWTNREFWSPYTANLLYGRNKKSRIQRICESHSPSLERVRQLLADGAKPDIKDKDGITALIVCVRGGNPAHSDIIQLLLDQGADPNQTTRSRFPDGAYSPLRIASIHNNLNATKLLIAKGAVVSEIVVQSAIESGSKETLLYLLSLGHPLPRNAVKTAVIHYKIRIIQTLVKAGADVNAEYPLHYAIHKGNINNYVRILCTAGADVNLIGTGEVYEAPLHSTPLDMAILIGNDEAVKILCEYKVNINYITNYVFRETPLQRAMKLYKSQSYLYAETHEHFIRGLSANYMKCVMILLTQYPDLSLRDEEGHSFLDSSAIELNEAEIHIDSQ
jgi:ankyrin repeat protein